MSIIKFLMCFFLGHEFVRWERVKGNSITEPFQYDYSVCKRCGTGKSKNHCEGFVDAAVLLARDARRVPNHPSSPLMEGGIVGADFAAAGTTDKTRTTFDKKKILICSSTINFGHLYISRLIKRNKYNGVVKSDFVICSPRSHNDGYDINTPFIVSPIGFDDRTEKVIEELSKYYREIKEEDIPRELFPVIKIKSCGNCHYSKAGKHGCNRLMSDATPKIDRSLGVECVPDNKHWREFVEGVDNCIAMVVTHSNGDLDG